MSPEERAVVRTLLNSLSHNLNVSLTPNDSAILLRMLKPIKDSPAHRDKSPIERVIGSAASMLSIAIDNIADEIEDLKMNISPPKRKRHDK